jgi:signal transduction histidine kinase
MFSRPEGSLEARLQILLGLLLVLLLAGLTGLGVWMARQTAMQFVASRLAHDAEAILAAIDPQERQIARSLPAIYQQPFSGHYLSVRFNTGETLRSRSLWDEGLPAISLSPGEQTQQRLTGPRRQQLLLWSAGYQKGGQQLTLSLAEDISPLLLRFNELLRVGLLAALASAALLLLAQKLLLRRMFQRLDDVRRQVKEVTQGKRQHLDESVPGEIRPLVHEFNQLLNGLHSHLERARHAAGNLAHALKGPLSLLYQHGQRLPDSDISEQTGQMRHLIDRELHRARLAGNALAGRHFHPQADCRDLLDTIRSLYVEKSLQITSELHTPSSLPLDQDDMLELLGNLLDNAAKWADSQILLRLHIQDDRLEISLQDDGPGIPAALGARLKQRGARLDEAVAGHGLGLAIVSDVIESYGGGFAMTRSSRLGGLHTHISLPLHSKPV